MLKKLLLGLVALALLLVISVVVALAITAPEPPLPGSPSADWLQPGPYQVDTAEYVFVDASRPTAANRDYAGAPQRTFNTSLWYPRNAGGALPLVIHSHGVVSSRSDLAYVARHLASHGYVVAAADYPLTSGSAPGGANPADVANQPADISFLIDSVLGLTGDRKPFQGTVDLARIGLTGYSLGGLTATLATFHPRYLDSRVAATVSIAGPAAAFTERFYQAADTPFLMIAGSADSLINHRANAVPIPQRAPAGDLLTIFGGTHLGFAALSEPMLRFLNQPDSLGCGAVLATLGDSSTAAIFGDLGSADEGVVIDDSLPEVCEVIPDEPLAHPGRQQMITTIAVLSFFESVFAAPAARRTEARAELAAYLEQDFAEALFTD